jgi:phenylpyruvate tautomerase PptA (4-oxalocrotonate tautomerase family)
MPLVRLDLIEGRNAAEIASLLDASHRAIVSAFGTPERDRYQVVHEHRRDNVIFQDSGLAIPRTDRVVLVSITTRPRSEASKLAFFGELCRLLKVHCGIESSDVIVSIVTNADEDWSFGYGRAQFKTGEL